MGSKARRPRSTFAQIVWEVKTRKAKPVTPQQPQDNAWELIERHIRRVPGYVRRPFSVVNKYETSDGVHYTFAGTCVLEGKSCQFTADTSCTPCAVAHHYFMRTNEVYRRNYLKDRPDTLVLYDGST